MTKALKELIANAPKKNKGAFYEFMFISNGVYDGFWGKNEYNNILILGKDEERTWCIVSEYGDKFDIYKTNIAFNLDIPKEYRVPRIWFGEPIYIDDELELSSVTGYTKGYYGEVEYREK